MDGANPNSDRYFDLSLRLLTIFVLVSLFCCVTFLSYRWLEPRWNRNAVATTPPPARTAQSPPPAAEATPPPADQVLMDPRKTFKCEERGKATSFSDRPSPSCEKGSVQILPLGQPQPATSGR
jgi:hypothetical protein